MNNEVSPSVFDKSSESTFDTDRQAMLVNAHQWLDVAQRSLDIRIDEYSETGNAEAAEALKTLHQSTLDMLRESVAGGKNNFIKFLHDLELGASSGQSHETPSYVVQHGLQLDELAQMVRYAQQRADDREQGE